MKLKTVKQRYILAAFIVAVMLIFSIVCGGAVKVRAAAVTSAAVSAYEQRNVWDDLQGATVDGKSIDLTLYNFDEKKNVQVVSFVEFCYSYQSDKQSDYGLYLYVYNPRGYDWTKDKDDRQNIKMRYGGNSSAHFEAYSLRYLNRSEEKGYEGLFYKFKIELDDNERAAILAGVNSAGRIYEIGEIELCSTGNDLTAYSVSNTYTYTGYAQGYGSESADGDSLNCKSDGLMTLTLNVESAAFRPENTNGKPFTQDMLHSVYFSIPNKILTDYGGLSAVKAKWLNAKTAPMFVTGNETVFNDISEQIESYGGELKEHTEYSLLVNASDNSTHIAGVHQYRYSADSAYNVDGVAWFCDEPLKLTKYYGVDTANKINYLYYAFLADNGNADGYELKGEKIIEYLKYYTEKLSSGGELVAGKYSSELFESYDSEYTEKNIKADDKYSLTNTKLSPSFWEWVLGKPATQVEYSKTFDDIEAIHPVTPDDFRNTEAATCKRLYIDESYYNDFKAYYDRATKADETVFLFRYYQSEYISKEVTEFIRRYDVNGFMQVHATGGDVALEKLDTNAYMAQEVINLDFDIIDITCSAGKVETVIPCIMSPIDVVPDLTPPLETTPDEEPFDFWEWLAELLHVNVKAAKTIFGVVVGLIVLAIVLTVLSALLPTVKTVLQNIASALCTVLKYFFVGLGLILKYLFLGLWWIISAPFRLIAKAVKSRKDKPRKAKPKRKGKSKPKRKTNKKAGKRK